LRALSTILATELDAYTDLMAERLVGLGAVRHPNTRPAHVFSPAMRFWPLAARHGITASRDGLQVRPRFICPSR
jgi:hypothetical protein